MENRIYGYTRVSSKGQNLDRGIETIKTFCKEHGLDIKDRDIFTDKQTGKNFNREQYITMKNSMRSGDVLVIPEYDRLGRANETVDELRFFKKIGVSVYFVDIPTTYIAVQSDDEFTKRIYDFINDTLISVFQLLATTELERKKKRQMEGIAAKKKRGEWEDYGRPRRMSKEDFAERYKAVEDGEKKTTELMRELGLPQETYYRYVREYKTKKS